MDTDGDGKITYTEFWDLLDGLNVPIIERNNIYKVLDERLYGFIDYHMLREYGERRVYEEKLETIVKKLNK